MMVMGRCRWLHAGQRRGGSRCTGVVGDPPPMVATVGGGFTFSSHPPGGVKSDRKHRRTTPNGIRTRRAHESARSQALVAMNLPPHLDWAGTDRFTNPIERLRQLGTPDRDRYGPGLDGGPNRTPFQRAHENAVVATKG